MFSNKKTLIATIVLTASLSASGSWKAEQINVEWDENSIGMSIERITCSSDGSIYASSKSAISKITANDDGSIWTAKLIAGNENPGFVDGSGLEGAQFNYPSSITSDSGGNLYVFDMYNQAIRKLTPMGKSWEVSTLGTDNQWKVSNAPDNAAKFGNQGIITSDGSNLYLVDSNSDKITFKKINPSSDKGPEILYTDTGEKFNTNTNIACDDYGNLYFTGYVNGSDDNNSFYTTSRVYKIDTSIDTSSDPATVKTAASIKSPYLKFANIQFGSIAYDKGNGNLYVADPTNKLIRQLAHDKETDSWTVVSKIKLVDYLKDLDNPPAFAVNSKSEVFVVDKGRPLKFTFVKDETAPSEEELAEENRLAEEAEKEKEKEAAVAAEKARIAAEEAEQEKKAAAAEEAKQKADKEEAKLKAAKYRAEERAKRNAAKAKFKAREEAKREGVNGGAWHVVSEFIWHPVKSIQSIWSALSFWWCS